MTLSEIRNDIGSKINQYSDETDTFVEGFITETELDRWINQAFEELYMWYALANKGRFSVKATVDTVEDQGVYTFGGDATDLLALESVGIKYSSTDTYYKTAYPNTPKRFYLEGGEEAAEGAPMYFERQIYDSVNEEYVLAIEFPEDCIPDTAVTDGLQVWYIERPPELSTGTDEPQKLPKELHKYIVIGASVPALEKMGEYDQASYLEGKFNTKVKSFFIQDQTKTAKGVKTVTPTRESINKFYKRIR
jgi:hypothetical protein